MCKSVGHNILSRALLVTVLMLTTLSRVSAIPLAPGLGLEVLDGKAGMASIPFVLKGTVAEAPGDLRIAIASQEKGPVTIWQVRVADLAGADRWLEVVLARKDGLKGEGGYFDGLKPIKVSASPQEFCSGQGLPLVALWDDNQGFAIALEPHQEVGCLRHSATTSNASAEIRLHTRIVVDAHAEKEVMFISFPISGKWGFYEALEKFYSLAPDFYEINRQVDPRSLTASAMYVALEGVPFFDELCRRNYAGWEWVYAPFKRTGDILGREEFWNYQSARPQPEDRPFESVEKYHSWRKQIFAKGERGNVAMMFYVPSQTWCEERLAKERYADALTQDPAAKCYFDTPWVTGWDNELRVLPWNTSFGEQSKKDLAEVANELDLSGFAFDVAEGDARYFGPHVKEFPERAWDPQLGEYVREASAIKELMKLVHGLRNSRGRPMAIVSNLNAPNYSSARFTDAAIHEAPPWGRFAGLKRGTADYVRFMMGRKPVDWWQGYYEMKDIVQCENLTPEQMVEVYKGLSDFVILECFRLGFLPTVDFTRGISGAVAALPMLVDCVRAGWRPMAAARADGAAFVTRYGMGLDTRLAIGNESPRTARPTVEVENPLLGEGSLIFGTWEGHPLRNAFSPGLTVVRGLEVPSRRVDALHAWGKNDFIRSIHSSTVGVMRAWAQVTPSLGSGSAEASVQQDLNGVTLTLKLPHAIPSGSVVSVPVPIHGVLQEVRVDGQVVTGRAGGGIASVAVSAGGGRKIVFVFTSSRYGLTRRQLEEFPFVKEMDRKPSPGATIVLRPGAGEMERLAAERLVKYFQYYYAGALDTSAEVTLPTREGADSARGPMIVLDGSGGAFARTVLPDAPKSISAPYVGVSGDKLYVVAPDANSCHDAVGELLFKLGRKYFYPGDLPARAENNALGLSGKYIGLDGQIRGTPPVERKQ